MNEFLESVNSFTVETVTSDGMYRVGKCPICGEGVLLEFSEQFRICDECRQAVLYVRSTMENKDGPN